MLLDREDREALRVMGFWRWAYAGTLYRPVSRFLHRYNWHHTRVLGPFPDGSVQHWCEWCGLRYQTKPIDYAKVAREMTLAEVGKTGD